MAYPTLARLCKRLLAEGKVEDVLDLISSFKDVGHLGAVMDDYQDLFPWGMKRAIIQGYNEWVEYQASDPAKLASSFQGADFDHYSEETLEKLAYVLRGVLDPDTGFAGTLARSVEELKSIPLDERHTFQRYVLKKYDDMSYRAIKAFYSYNDTESLRRELQYMIRDDFHKKAQFDVFLKDAYANFKQYMADADDDTKGFPPEYQDYFDYLKEIYLIVFKYGARMGNVESEMYDLEGNARNIIVGLAGEKKDPQDPEVIAGLTKALKNLVYRNPDSLGRIEGTLSNLKVRMQDFMREEDPYYKQLPQQISEIVGHLKNMDSDDVSKIFKVLDVKDPKDQWSNVRISSSIYTMIEMGVVEFFADQYYSRMFYDKFKKLPEMMQRNFATIMKDAARAWIEERRKEDEEMRKKVPPEAKGEDAPFQDYAFADQRTKKVPREPNTPAEENLFKKLKSHFRNNTPISVDEAEEIREILRNEHYRSIFHEPKNAYAYRGMKVAREWLERAVGWNGAKMEAVGAEKKFPDVGKKAAKFTFTPRSGGATSWTVDLDAAIQFASGPDQDEYSIIIAAKVKDNPIGFVAGPGGLYDVPGLDAYPEEKEAVALGRIKVMKVFWRKKGSIKRADITSKPAPKEKKEKPKKKDVYGGSLSSKTKKKPIPKKSTTPKKPLPVKKRTVKKGPPKKKVTPGYY